MRRILTTLAFMTLVSLPGCTWYDAWFNTLGDRYYSGGGPSGYDKRADYDEHVQAYGANP
jgi:hypothetical protein